MEPGRQDATELEQHRQAIRLHCYRLTGSLHDADDLTQEVLVKAWQKLAGFRGESSLSTWLHRIATNACLDFLRGKKHRALPWGPPFPQYVAGQELPVAGPEVAWLEPFPDPADQTLRREHLSLAFLTLLQTLPPRQRAAVVLADLGYASREIAAHLDLSPAAVNSALQRGRKTLGSATPRVSIGPQDQREVVDRFLKAWEAGDAAAIVALMTDDSTMVMPPIPLWVRGRSDILRVLVEFPFRWGDPQHWKLVPVAGANGEPAAGFYERDPSGVYRPWGMQVLVLGRDPGGATVIAEYHVFKGPHLVRAFGLP